MSTITCVGIDVSKGRSTVAAMRPGGEVVMTPREVLHTAAGLAELVKDLSVLGGELRIVMEYTGAYYLPIARALCVGGFFVSVVHAKLVHDFGNNSIRRGKTDKKDAVKIANYGLANWLSLPQFHSEDAIRQQLKILNRQRSNYGKIKIALKNNLIALLDQTFPGVKNLFASYPRELNGHEKWIDFALTYWHRDCVSGISFARFVGSYSRWCKRMGYYFREEKAAALYNAAVTSVPVLGCDEVTKLIITQAAAQLNAVIDTQFSVQAEMDNLASQLTEYDTVMAMFGVGKILGAQLIAEIGDVTRFHSKRALTAFAGLDSPPFQSGTYEAKERKISKRGSPHLRRTLFNIAAIIAQRQPADNEVYKFLDRKRSEGKHYFVYMTAAANKFLRIYYGKVKASIQDANINSMNIATPSSSPEPTPAA